MGRSEGAGSDAFLEGDSDEQPEHSVTVSEFAFDKYEVTVGRFRKFADAYDSWREAGHPSAGEGQHPNIANTGWQSDWNEKLVVSRTDLTAIVECHAPFWTWTDDADENETLPMNCVDWYHAFAFCLWDGGRLPTEAEWEYAATGGSQNRLYPWGLVSPGSSNELAIQGCYYNGTGPGSCTGSENIPPVGSAPDGNGRWGHADLAGSLYEWTFDWYEAKWYTSPNAIGTNVANLVPTGVTSYRTLRGGAYDSNPALLRAARRAWVVPGYRDPYLGLRCARDL